MRHIIEDQLDAYVTETLAPESRREIEQHVAGCRTCREAVEVARSAGFYLQWLSPTEAPPEPGPGFYLRLQESIERKRYSGWFTSLAVARPRLAYPLLLLGCLLMVWTLTVPPFMSEEDLVAMEFPLVQGTATSRYAANPSLTQDDVMLSLFELAESSLE